MEIFTSLFSLAVAGVGWYYMFYSRGAVNLHGIEDETLNHRRQVLRRIGGFVLLLLGVAMFAGFHSVDSATSAQAFVLVWMSVFVLLLVVLLLAMADLRLTWKLRRRRDRRGVDTLPPRK
jgi:cytochrome bd-type quinol oxidase subunit 2